MPKKDETTPAPATFAPIETEDVSKLSEAERAEKTQFKPLETSAPAQAQPVEN